MSMPKDHPFVYSLFGVQYPGDSPNEKQQSLIDRLDQLITPSAKHVDRIIQDGISTGISGGNTRIWLGYWTSKADFNAWWQQPDTVAFWASLPPDAGVWREIVTVSPSRTQFNTSAKSQVGQGHLGASTDHGTKVGYWGCYRDRMEDSSPTERFQSSLSETPEPRRAKTTDTVREGRLRLTHFPDNLCFVVEGQDRTGMTDEERAHWFEKLDGPVEQWMKDLENAGPEKGVLDARMCYDPDSDIVRDKPPVHRRFARTIQLFYFRDLAAMELIGKTNSGHVGLRMNFMKPYGPRGPLFEKGNMVLWVETSVVRAQDIDCEYVGCVEGTGFLAYDYHAAFKDEAKL
ncbi:hypothetical protein ASPWEDRAFT_37953 [Aspergillus wentii DTO 134E9]|uniref:Phenylacetaldoxime dehydratase n=1 Tax=Aspergillus wentii DTO 134E9 TaxID=1073089 RepID=A0A1L9RNH5_ASPWE|nr:uncharacterized protein ASPWEDRAFT_37953 [Aspergillus wentii DTO 134E9]OJJ36387.1 hypothetical protein ASPWEDRAFT_37953 [Aspergillus wentii DTO 134E9]